MWAEMKMCLLLILGPYLGTTVKENWLHFGKEKDSQFCIRMALTTLCVFLPTKNTFLFLSLSPVPINLSSRKDVFYSFLQLSMLGPASFWHWPRFSFFFLSLLLDSIQTISFGGEFSTLWRTNRESKEVALFFSMGSMKKVANGCSWWWNSSFVWRLNEVFEYEFIVETFFETFSWCVLVCCPGIIF